MKPPVESVRISALGREQLMKLKRQTGIANWNVLCRWALCCSLREASVPTQAIAGGETGVEMTWKVFAGDQSDTFSALIHRRTTIDGFNNDPEGIGQCLRAHLHRGLGYLASETGQPGITGFMERWLMNHRADKAKS